MTCRADYHVGSTCEQYQEWLKENGQAEQLFDKFVQVNTRVLQCATLKQGENQSYLFRHSGSPSWPHQQTLARNESLARITVLRVASGLTGRRLRYWPMHKSKNFHLRVLQGMKLKKCPKCNRWVEKASGCNHITCKCTHQLYVSEQSPTILLC